MNKQKGAKKTQSQNATNDTSPYVYQRDKIDYSLNIRDLPWTPKQKEIIALCLDKHTKVVFLKGSAGTSKTTLAMYVGLQLLNAHRVSDIVLVRSAVESADSKLGFLPGDIAEKFNVYLTPFNDKFQELLPANEITKLQKDNRITMCPINYARGLHFAARFVCCDEFQNFVGKSEAKTILTRIGEFCKVMLCGDPDQSDLPPGKSGFNEVYELFDNQESRDQGIFCVELTDADIVRSELCRFIVKKFKEMQKQHEIKQEQKQLKPEKSLTPAVVSARSHGSLPVHEWRPRETHV